MRIMISCGEASGDMYAGALAAELRRRVPDAEIFGFGGPRLKDAGGRLVADYSPLSVTGITEAVKIIPRSFAMLRKLVDAARELRPHVFVAIDFPDFNFRLMAALRRLGAISIHAARSMRPVHRGTVSSPLGRFSRGCLPVDHHSRHSVGPRALARRRFQGRSQADL